MKTLTCPNCGTQIPLEEAVTHQIREELVREFQGKSAQRDKAFVEREAKLAGLQAQLDKSRETLDREVERRVQDQADKLRAQARKQAEAALELQLRDLHAELGEKEQKLVEATKAELELRKKQRELESRQQAMDLEVTRRMDEEREKIRQDAVRAAAEEQHLRLSATALRQGLVSVANSRLAADGKTGKMELLYEYLAGTEFRQKVEAIVEAFVTMKNDLENEQRAYARIWARRERQIEQVITNTALMYGGIQGIVGQSTLPEIASLELPQADDILTTGE